MKKLLFLFFSILFLLLMSGCNQSEEVGDISKFTSQEKGDFLLFQLMDPFSDKGYINEVNHTGEIVFKHIVTDKHFAPSDIFQFEGNYYFASGAYSNDSKVMEYDPENVKLSLIDTNQEEFIEKYYKYGDSEYIVTVTDKEQKNKVCEINHQVCQEFSGEYIAQDVTILNDCVIITAFDTNAPGDAEDVVSIKMLTKDLELLEEIHLNTIPNYFTYTSPDQKLYLFMMNGDIVEIDSELNVNTFSMDLSNISESIVGVSYNKNVMIDQKRILLNLQIHELENDFNFLASIYFGDTNPKLEIIENSNDEMVLNIDNDSNEVYTRSYVDDKMVINVRDTKTLRVKETLELENDNPVYFVDNFNK